MIEPTKDDIGREVVYYKEWMRPDQMESGIIINFNEMYVFVKYKNDFHSKATYREDLRWEGK